jgi:hypothetical protein
MTTYEGLTQGQLMTLTGCSITTVRNMTLKSVFLKNPDGSFDSEKCIRQYIEYLKKRHGTGGEVGMEDRDPDTEFRKQKARKERMLADQMEGILIEVGDVARMWESHIYAAKAKFLALPDKLVAELLPLLRDDTRMEEVRDPAKRMVDEALEELSKEQELDEEAEEDGGTDEETQDD